MVKKERISKENYKEVWKDLIEKEGYQDGSCHKLQCFDICGMYGIDLADSTIDEIVLMPDGRIGFFYNVNTGDYDLIEHFKYKDLKDFYNGLVDSMNEEEEFVRMENAGEGKDAW